MDIFSLSHQADPCALFRRTPYFQLGSADREYRQIGGKERSAVRLPSLQLPPCILTSPSSIEDWSSCQGGSSTEYSPSPESGGLSCLRAVALPSSQVGTYLCGSLDSGRSSDHSALIKLWNLVTYCTAGDSLPSWLPGHSLLFPMLTHPLSPPLANPLLWTEEFSPYVL